MYGLSCDVVVQFETIISYQYSMTYLLDKQEKRVSFELLTVFFMLQ